jgi:biotin carboxylase
VRLFLVASEPTDAVTFGFLPAAARLGLDVVLLTDQPDEHARALAAGPSRLDSQAKPWIVACDVRDASALIGQIAGLRAPDAIFTNSDRLGVQTALAADYFGVPGKDWRACLRSRDKLLMRRRLAHSGVAAVEIGSVPARLRYPVVVKPADDPVTLVRGPDELARRRAEVSGRLICEEFLPGTPRTLETLGDGRVTWVFGGFRTRVSAPPFFIKERLTWDPLPPGGERDQVSAALGELGVSFGAAHTEFIDDGQGGATLVGVNDRLIGDHGDFLLASLLGMDLFECVLRVHIGQPLPDGPPLQDGPRLPDGPPLQDGPSAARGHAVADYVVAGQPGVLRAAPSVGPMAGAEPGVELGYWPLRQPGERIAVTHSNRDYLGVITAVGPDRAAVERSVAAGRSGGVWVVS